MNVRLELHGRKTPEPKKRRTKENFQKAAGGKQGGKRTAILQNQGEAMKNFGTKDKQDVPWSKFTGTKRDLPTLNREERRKKETLRREHGALGGYGEPREENEVGSTETLFGFVEASHLGKPEPQKPAGGLAGNLIGQDGNSYPAIWLPRHLVAALPVSRGSFKKISSGPGLGCSYGLLS